MPLWKVYHPEHAFSPEDKHAIARRITGIYRDLPPFYVGVVFEAVPKSAFFIGGEPADDFVRIAVDHIARQLGDDAVKQQFLSAVTRQLAPFITERGLRWEMHIDETPFSLWVIEGYRPPLPGSADEVRWRTENRPSPLKV